MKYYKRQRLTAGAIALAMLCICAGCGKEEDIQITEEAEIREEEPESTAAIEDTAEEKTTGEETERRDEELSLEGTTVSIFGDSISTYEDWIPYGYNNFYPESGDVKDVNDTWWIRMFDDTGMKLCANASSAGSACVGDSTDAEDPQVGCGDFRITDLSDKNGTYPDIIIVFIGTNDLLMSIPLGDNDGTVIVEEGMIDNFADAYSLMLDKLETYYPCSEIYCCTLLQVGDYGTATPYVAFTNGLGLTAEDYSERIKMIAGNKGCPVIDLYRCGIEIDNLQDLTTDGVHPNAEGMKYIAEAAVGTIMDVRTRR